MKINALKILMLFFFTNLYAVDDSDSLTLSYSDFVGNILLYHPIAKQAQLRVTAGDAERLSAKGNFDPELSSSFAQKNFDDKLYYQLFSTKLKIPTPIGVDLVGGYEQNSGTYLNNQNKTNTYGLWNLGVEANVLQGLLTDERRTALKRADVYQKMAENDKTMLLNDLLWNASEAYLEWQNKWQVQRVLLENVDLAKTYFSNTLLAYSNGEKAAIDTLEATVVWLNMITEAQSNKIKMIASRQKLENFLWFKSMPVVLQAEVKPQASTEIILGELDFNLADDELLEAPPITNKRLEKDLAELDLKLSKQKALPKLKLKFNPLLGTSNSFTDVYYSTSNYKWGIDFSVPLFVRSERSKIQKDQIKVENKQFEILDKENRLLIKSRASLEKQEVLKDQLRLQQNKVGNIKTLLQAENKKFAMGESSVFLLNKRLEKSNEAQIKLVELQTKLQLEVLNYLYLTNSLLPE